MKQLTCEMCGSIDLIKQDGVFVCQTCGTKYSVEEAKKMMIEGTVKIDKTSEVENLIKKMFTYIETCWQEESRKKALECCDKILDIDYNSGEAYLGRILIANKIPIKLEDMENNSNIDFSKQIKITLLSCEKDKKNFLFLKVKNYLEKFVKATEEDFLKDKLIIKYDKEWYMYTDEITSIGEKAFAFFGSKFISIKIPKSINSISVSAFVNCENLIEIKVDEGNSAYKVVDGFFYSSDGSLLLKYIPIKKETNITIPNYVKNIGDNAFSSCSSLTSVTIGDSVISIGKSAFSDCSSLTSVNIPNSVTSIGEYAFYNCNSFQSVTFGENSQLESIGKSAFSGCSSLTSIEIPNRVISIGESVFWECSSLASVTIPNSVTSIGKDTFYNCISLVEIAIPEGLRNIGERAFDGCGSLTNILVNEIVNLNNDIHFDNELEISDCAFRNCNSLVKITLPNGIKRIGVAAFADCSSLTSIEIPNSVICIGDSAFSSCSSLRNVVIPNTVTSMGKHAFSKCINLIQVTIPNGVTCIREYAFSGCSSLTSIEIPNSLKEIREGAFSVCSSLTSISIPNSVTDIGAHAFACCSKLTIYCEVAKEPSRWRYKWNYSGCPVVWEYKKIERERTEYLLQIKELEKIKNNLSSLQELREIQKQIELFKKQKEGLGFLKIKRKKTIQDKIDALNVKEYRINNQVIEEQNKIDKEIEAIRRKIQHLS